MKNKIQPKYYPSAQIKCVCGQEYKVGSTKEALQIEVCSNCHPFYTGQEKVLDVAGRVEKFRARREMAKSSPAKKTKKVKTEKKEEDEEKEKNNK